MVSSHLMDLELPPLLKSEVELLTTLGNDYRASRAMWSEWCMRSTSSDPESICSRPVASLALLVYDHGASSSFTEWLVLTTFD